MSRLYTSLGLGLLAVAVAVSACGSDPEGILDAPADPGLANGTPDPLPEAPGPACSEARQTYAATREPSNVLFLYDRSGSMHIQLASKATRWNATKKGFFDLLAKLPATTGAGLMLFPQGDAPVNAWCKINATTNDVDCDNPWPEPGSGARCDAKRYVQNVPSALLGAPQVAALHEQIVAQDRSFYWGTPLASALSAAIATQRASTLPGAKSVILLTDGNPTSCGDSGIDNDIDNVVAAAAKGLKGTLVRTFVIGLVDSAIQAAKAENLSPIAVAGGTKRFDGCEKDDACFYRLTDKNFAEDLKKVFEEVSLQAFDCTFSLPANAAGADPSLLTVQLADGTTTRTVPRDTTRKDGWEYLPNGSQIQLYGPACTGMRAANAELRVVLGCPAVTVPATPRDPVVR